MRVAITSFTLLYLCAFASAAEISSDDVKAAIEAKYGPFSEGANLQVTVDSVTPYMGSQTANETDLPDGFKAIVWDEASDRFAALIEGDDDEQVRVAGTASKLMQIPIATRRLSVGEIITTDDVVLHTFKLNPNARDYVMNMDEIIGKEVTRPISPDRPVNSEFLAEKNVIKRNDDVVLILSKGNLRLTAKGKSLSNAAIGETVKIIRSEALRPLEGIAVAEGVVEIKN